VVSNLSAVHESDVRAIAVYMADVSGVPTPDRKRRGEEARAGSRPAQAPQGGSGDASGGAVYAAACSTCHGGDRPPPFGGIDLALSSAISGPDARNAANIVLSGIRPREGERSPIMPGFADSMTDEQIAALLTYLRARFGGQPAWTGIVETVRDARRSQSAVLQISPSPTNAPTEATKRDKP
jgi:mono/diheme cytochrome c family protein